MVEDDSIGDSSETSEKDGSVSDDETEFLGAGPEEALKINPSAEEAFSAK